MLNIVNEQQLVGLCLALIGAKADLSRAEQALVRRAIKPTSKEIQSIRKAITAGFDPLGDFFTALRSPAVRREAGAVYTPDAIAKSMVRWIAGQVQPARIVDGGAGSGRFTLAAAAWFPRAQLIAVENDPIAALMLRANLAVHGWDQRATVLVADYRSIDLPVIGGKTAFIGNPPYVRHHQIDERWKSWYADEFAELGITASSLAGLHAHFFLKTRLLGQNGDIGALITSAEWMDVNYGSALRRLLIDELGGLALHVLEPSVEAFPGTATTAAITCFRIGEKSLPLRVRSVVKLSSLNGLSKGTEVRRSRFKQERRWSAIIRPDQAHVDGVIELGELFRVHRGQVTGANDVWVSDGNTSLPESVLFPSITKARDLIKAGEALTTNRDLRRVIDLPAELDGFTDSERRSIKKFLTWAKAQGADQSYIALHRKAWWSVGLRPPAPILCTYMARRPPQFTLNKVGARHINIAHGLYPRESLPSNVLSAINAWLNKHIKESAGRTYAGGLTKFEPKEIERLRIPRLEDLQKS